MIANQNIDDFQIYFFRIINFFYFIVNTNFLKMQFLYLLLYNKFITRIQIHYQTLHLI